MSYEYHVIVIGSGSAGKEACLAAAKAGLQTLLVEEKDLGGTSVHRGSNALRALRASATLFKRIQKGRKVGTPLDSSETIWTDWQTDQLRTSSSLTAEIRQAVDREHVHLCFGKATLVGPNEISVAAPGGPNRRITASHIIIATGSRPNFTSQPEVGVLNSDDLLRRPASPRHLFVIGGGYIGCEIASIYRDLGARVTIAEAQSRLLPNWDVVAGQYFQKALEAAGVDVLLNHEIVVPSTVPGQRPTYRLNDETSIQPDVTLLATGRSPNSDEIGLEAVGLCSGDWIPVNDHMRTKVESIYAIGDVTGMALLDSIAKAQANVAVQTILGIPASFDKRRYPQLLHTEPPIASVGLTEDEADASGLPVEVLTWSGPLLADSTMGEPEHMVIKCLVHAQTDLIFGCIAIGSGAAEVIDLVSEAMVNGQSARDIARLPAVHSGATEALAKTLRSHVNHPIACVSIGLGSEFQD
jgi:dihydrolipoamide dehydrogenase